MAEASGEQSVQMHCAELPALASWEEQHPSYRLGRE